MVVMAEYVTQDRLSELRHHINQLHYSYLSLDESPDKLKQRNKLEAYIREYLCLVPSQHKFSFRETADVLHRSASYKTNFSGYRAALAWNALSMYAGNLLAQPWRKEYRTIKLYSGFYKHEIEANLVGAEVMLEVMGYKHVGNSVMVLDGPICPDRVANVSRDSLVAFVECQILKTIWEEVSTHFKITWLEVLEFREKHTCSPENAIQLLVYRWHDRNYQPNYITPTIPHNSAIYSNQTPHVIDNYTRYPSALPSATAAAQLYGTPSPYYGYATYPVSNYPIQPIVQHHQPPARCLHGTYPSIPVVPPTKTNIYMPSNGYCCPNGAYTTPNSGIQQARTVPTGQLIELDNYQADKKRIRDEGTGTFESWDYVFRNLESQGYNKDMGQRGDLLLSPSDKKQTRRQSKDHPTNRIRKLSDTMQKLKLHDDDTENHVAHSSSYDNLSSHSSTANKPLRAINYKTKSLPRESKSLEQTRSQTLDPAKKRNKTKLVEQQQQQPSDEIDSKNNKSSNWHCNACTYLNSSAKEICEMCGKSRSLITSPMAPMAVGGSECPKCTLINEKNVKTCDACGASLTNSPTYI